MNSDVFVLAQSDTISSVLAVVTCCSTFAGAVILLFYTIYTKRLVNYTKDLARIAGDSLGEARDSSAAALAQTIKSNENTERSNEISQSAIELGNRAWVVTVGVETPAQVYPKTITVMMENAGRVPAVQVEVSTSFVVCKPADFEKIEIPVLFSRNYLVVIPSGRITPLHTSLPLTEENQTQLSRGSTLYFFVRIDYTDTFRKLRKSISCWYFSGEVAKWVVAPKFNDVE